MSTNKKITVIGGTGNLGIPVVNNLISLGFQVKIIARNPVKAVQIFGHLTNLEIVKGDLCDKPSLKQALQGTTYLYLNLSTQATKLEIPFATEREGMQNIVASVDQSSIRQIIMISGLGAMENHNKPGSFEFVPNTIRKQGHRILKDSGIPYTILHCSWFIDSFLFYRRKDTYTVIGNNVDPIYFTNCYDYTMNMVHALDNKAALFQEFPIQGREGIIHSEAARRFYDEYDPSSKVKVLPSWLLNTMASFSKEMKYVKHMADYTQQCPESFLAEEFGTYRILGNPELDTKGYASKLRKEEPLHT
jgi:NAD(P)H-binding